MKKKKLIKNIAFSAIMVCFTLGLNLSVKAQLLVENFEYTAGQPITVNGWTAHSAAGTNAILVSNGGLTYPGYVSSNIGNAASMTTSGEDDNRTFADQTTGTVYAAFMVNVSAANTTGDYFFHLAQAPASGGTFRGRVYARIDAGSNLSFGVSKAGGTINYTGFTYALNTTYLIVLKYTIVAGATNDTVDLFINPPTTGIEPAATISATDITGADPASLGAVALRQGTAASAPTLVVDGIRVGTTFAGAVPNGATAAPVSVSGIINLPPNMSLNRPLILVTLTDSQGVSQSVAAGKTGGFRFRNVVAGETYILRITAKGYNFAPQVIIANEDISGLNFAPLE